MVDNIKPIYQSEFADAAINPSLSTYQSFYLGTAFSENEQKDVDLFYIKYASGCDNAIYQYSDDPECYSSGIGFMYNDLIQGLDTARTEIYKRALDRKIISIKSGYFGISDKKDDEIELEFQLTEDYSYFKNKPCESDFWNSLPENISDEDEDILYEKFNKSLSDYDKSYLENHTSIPVRPEAYQFHEFKNQEEAELYCSGIHGIYGHFEYTTKTHLREILNQSGLKSKLFKLQIQSGR